MEKDICPLFAFQKESQKPPQPNYERVTYCNAKKNTIKMFLNLWLAGSLARSLALSLSVSRYVSFLPSTYYQQCFFHIHSPHFIELMHQMGRCSFWCFPFSLCLSLYRSFLLSACMCVSFRRGCCCCQVLYFIYILLQFFLTLHLFSPHFNDIKEI